uniref:ribonuclease Z n=1 Tax=Mesocestoides corti TaxID=53468 RepID=A0A5K3F869_MESCO
MRFIYSLLKNFGCTKIMMSPSSRVHISVVGTGSPGTPKSVLICTDSTRYLINCGEGTQRILTEHKSKASKIQHVFFTRMSWRHLSGLLGIALTVRTAGVKRMFVHGPPSVVELMKLTRHFADANTTEVVQSDILQKPFLDSDFKITAFELDTKDTSLEPRAKRVHLDDTSQSQPIYAYLFQGLRLRNKLDPAKCVACGIPASVLHSPKIRQLVDGQPLVLDDGKTISPQDVTIRAPSPRNLLVLECPHESYIPTLQQADQLFAAIRSPREGDPEEPGGLVPGVTLAVHFVPPGLFESSAYQTFVARLDQCGQRAEEGEAEEAGGAQSCGVHHLVVDGSDARPVCPPVTGIYGQSVVLNTHFDPAVYPQLVDLCSVEAKPDLSAVEAFSRVVYAQPMLRYFLRPHSGFSTEHCVALDAQDLIQQAFDPLYVSQAEADTAFAEMRREIDVAIDKRTRGDVKSRLDDLDWPEFTFLGTASSSPSKYRNISAILVRLSPNDCILLDCAEGTLNQLYALHGAAETHRLLRGLRLVLITHMHADHHGGVITIARKVYDLTHNTAGLPVLAPPPFWKWVNSYTTFFGGENRVRLFPITRVYEAPDLASTAADGTDACDPIWRLRDTSEDLVFDWTKILSDLHLKVEPVRVPHTGTSWAYVLSRVVDGGGEAAAAAVEGPTWKVVYSGDTPPCSQLAEAGRDCDLLIHEATMADGYEEQAVAARHSTTSEAIGIGRMMRAKFILLTHFSQRFSRLPSFDTFQEDIAPAFDFMRVKFRDLWKLPYFLPYYKYAFARHWELQQTRADANHLRKVRAEEALELTRSAVMEAVDGPASRKSSA